MKDLINPKLDLSTLKNTFKDKGYVVIDNYLKEDVAEKLHNFFSYEMPSDWWSVATYPSLENYDKVSYYRNTPEESENIKLARRYAEQEFGLNNFSYSFHRTLDNHFDDCDCYECQIRKFLNDKESHDLISEVTNLKITGSNEVFAACYVPGDFLSPHQDSPNGIVGFVLHLTKDWKPQYGGLLHFLNDEGTIVENIEVPKFNSLTLFLLPEDKGKLHYVSHVNPGSNEIRLSLTGWYRN
jgi:Rps23 Pro-64 3,4-dihydroxylase Tpa1-like proline 4-hydroxylase|tara:strand:- start:3113 stop:3832 length:720 start_codon:yes stop_codon:yes gene_type:complete